MSTTIQVGQKLSWEEISQLMRDSETKPKPYLTKKETYKFHTFNETIDDLKMKFKVAIKAREAYTVEALLLKDEDHRMRAYNYIYHINEYLSNINSHLNEIISNRVPFDSLNYYSDNIYKDVLRR